MEGIAVDAVIRSLELRNDKKEARIRPEQHGDASLLL
jgi:hypothetical protein